LLLLLLSILATATCLGVAPPSLEMPGAPFPIPIFECPKLPVPPNATNVRELRFGNIKAVMAMGDSISAGFAMKGFLPTDFLEYRDYVYSIGGAPGAMTIANWLAFYNPKVAGAAQSWTWPLTTGAWLDAGVSMGKVQDCPSQIDYLVQQLTGPYSSQINFEEDWKLLTLFIGANNICGSCKGDSDTQPAYFEQNLRNVLTLIEQKIPRVFVNLITIFNISGVWDAGQTSEYCRILWDGVTNHECYCLTTGNYSDRHTMDLRAVTFNQISNQLAAEFEANNNPNFTVVVQPGLDGIPIGQYGEIYLSKLDCFHPSIWANMAFTYSIWNNMMEPQGSKSHSPDPENIKILCPTANDYIQ